MGNQYRISLSAPAFWPFYKETIDKDSYKGSFYRARPDASHHTQIDTRLYVIDKFDYRKELMAKTFSADYPLQVADSMFLHRSFRDSIMVQIGRIQLLSWEGYQEMPVYFPRLVMWQKCISY